MTRAAFCGALAAQAVTHVRGFVPGRRPNGGNLLRPLRSSELGEDAAELGDWRAFRAKLMDLEDNFGLAAISESVVKKGSKTQSKKLKKSRQLKAPATEGGEGGSIIDEDAVLPTDAAKCTAEAEAAAQAAKAKERQAVAPRNTALLRQQSPALAEEYMEGGWAHAVVQPEAGGLLLR